MLGAGALGRPRGMVWVGRWEGGSGWGTCVYLWRIHADVWKNQYNIVKFKNKIKKKRTHLPKQETKGTQVQSLGWKDALEEEIATHSSILAYRIP